MPATPSELTSLDFFEIKESIKSYLRTRPEFTDYDFEGSTASYLIDILAYNTHYAAFLANMSMNEAFLESATVRDNIVRIAKQINYTPRSIKASKACVRVSAQTQLLPGGSAYPDSVTIKAGDVFISQVDGEAYTYAIMKDTQVAVDQNTGIASFEKLVIYQGNLLTFNYTVDDTKKQEYVIPADGVDTELLVVAVKPNEQSAEIDEYSLSRNVTALDSTSRVYFLEETEDIRYKVVFGDGVLGRKLIDNEFIVLTYIATDGPTANGATKFNFIGRAIDNTGRPILPSSMSLATIDGSQAGEDRESALSVKFRAPRAFSTQNRAVTENDYAHIVKDIFPQAAAVTAYGGEKLSPPEYGKVFIAVRSKSGVNLNTTTKKRIQNQLLDYSMASIQPIVVDPRIYYLSPKVYPSYDGNKTSRSSNELASEILKSIDKFNSQNRDDRFGGRLEMSKFNAVIDSSDNAIAGTTSQMTIGQNLDQFTFGNIFTQCLDFNNPIVDPGDYGGPGGNGDGDGTGGDGGDGSGGNCNPKFSSVKTGSFYATGYTEDVADQIAAGEAAGSLVQTAGEQAGFASALEEAIFSSDEITTSTLVPVNIRDDGNGGLIMVTNRNEKEVVLNQSVGTVDYDTGKVCVGPLNIADTPDGNTRVPVVVLPDGNGLTIPPGVDPTIFNPEVYPIDFVTNPSDIPNFDPFNFAGWNYGGGNINTINYPIDAFEYPDIDSCF
jgi:hypothetical protein|tara:strand:+ start:223 stop:2385 length:2163 start_codon:yes stop_codon:yes gene_type:complete